MVKAWPSKDPDEVLNFTYDWSTDLDPGEILTDLNVVITSAAGTVIEDQQLGPTAITLIISGGLDGQTANYEIRVTTNGVPPRIFEDSVYLPIAETLSPQAHPGDYTDPTPANLVWAFPEFGEVAADRIAFALKRASAIVDPNWSEADFAIARMLLAAHYMTEMGLGNSAEARALANGSNEYRSIGIGPLRLERFDKGGGGGDSGGAFSTTTYGRRFKIMLKLNRGGPRVTGGIAGGIGDGDRSQLGPWDPMIQ